jgi:putative oxidoreductase
MDHKLPICAVLGRILLGSIFVIGGLRHIPAFRRMTNFFRARGIPLPGLSLTVGTSFQIIVGSTLMLGAFQRAAAFGLVVFTIAASIIVHNFWDMEADARRMALFWWQSNIGIVGGLLLLAA